MTSVGCIFTPYENPPSRLVPFARAAEAAGLDEVWLWEDCFLESGIASAAAVLGATERVAVGIGVLPVPLRNATLTAMEVATLAGAFPGRFLPGVGHGVQDWMGQVGARVGSPLTLLREHLEALRALLAGERVTTSGRYVTLDDVALDWPPEVVPPVLSAAQGPKTLRLVGELADGAVLVADTGLAGVRRAVGLLDEGRAAAGLPPLAESRPGSERPFRLVANLAAATGPDAVERLRRECRGWNLDVPDDAALAEYCSWGSAEQVADGLRRFADLGVDALVVQPTLDEPDLDGLAAFLGEEVAPLLR
ncbi:LLM class flavin-dependent oxidoreductase [Isoptericola variabilis]|uniref:Luciferase-like, subgroup n=1 Tax=Isoptericola variabilis (strain 225) TaxID=743718 RepID=F6FSY9_ISOV2|nr:LLM class flavin-dependent oxidoreductase [Isoptericola variabilis]AEG43130.1 Luciferase-like, subgroup [Isoptericola variabilis 225]TWH35061.1 alkanesulfonate monooxygenase SsuD/methylene tetrahydromethanopterin reductase-like flavin-dependent oxidoreductase (luciferase family) [Isoptericola variabilis J7]